MLLANFLYYKKYDERFPGSFNWFYVTQLLYNRLQVLHLPRSWPVSAQLFKQENFRFEYKFFSGILGMFQITCFSEFLSQRVFNDISRVTIFTKKVYTYCRLSPALAAISLSRRNQICVCGTTLTFIITFPNPLTSIC